MEERVCLFFISPQIYRKVYVLMNFVPGLFKNKNYALKVLHSMSSGIRRGK